MRLWEDVVLCTRLYGKKYKHIVGFGILKCNLLYHFQVKPSFAVLMVLILDEDSSFKKYNVKFIFLGTSNG